MSPSYAGFLFNARCSVKIQVRTAYPIMLMATIQLVNATTDRVYRDIVVATASRAMTSQKAQNLFFRMAYAVTRLSAPVRPM